MANRCEADPLAGGGDRVDRVLYGGDKLVACDAHVRAADHTGHIYARFRPAKGMYTAHTRHRYDLLLVRRAVPGKGPRVYGLIVSGTVVLVVFLIAALDQHIRQGCYRQPRYVVYWQDRAEVSVSDQARLLAHQLVNASRHLICDRVCDAAARKSGADRYSSGRTHLIRIKFGLPYRLRGGKPVHALLPVYAILIRAARSIGHHGILHIINVQPYLLQLLRYRTDRMIDQAAIALVYVIWHAGEHVGHNLCRCPHAGTSAFIFCVP